MSKTMKMTVIVLAIFALQAVVFAQDAKFQQTSDGLVCMEAENYSESVESSSETYWDFYTDLAGYSGTGAMRCYPEGNTEHKVLENAQNSAPVLNYTVNFVSDEPVYLFLRASHIDGYDDSIWFGMDSWIYGDDPASFTSDEQNVSEEWYWVTHYMTGTTQPMIELESAGVHTFQMYMREAGFKLDKIVLTTDPAYAPEGEGPAETLASSSGVVASDVVMPEGLELAQNFPNPFNPETTIRYSLPQSEHVTCTIYNVSGQEVAQLVDEMQSEGVHQISWVAEGMESGVYFYNLTAGDHSVTKKLILQK